MIPNTSKLVWEWIKLANIKLQEWSSQSLNLNPIETLCTTRQSWFHTRKLTFCQEEWSNIHRELYQRLADGYQNHLADVHLADGHLTDYKHL